MLGFNSNLSVYVAVKPCDMRKSFNGLAAIVSTELGGDPLSGAAYLFTNRRRNLIKILYWDGSGWWVVSKRLEKGTFNWPRVEDAGKAKLRISATAMSMLTAGIDLNEGRKRPWYEHSENKNKNNSFNYL